MDDGSSSEGESSRVDGPHTAEIRLDLERPEWARIVCESLSADKEPKRSNAQRELIVEGHFLILRVRSTDRKSLQKCIANAMDMCDLAKGTIELADKKKWLDSASPAPKKSRIESH